MISKLSIEREKITWFQTLCPDQSQSSNRSMDKPRRRKSRINGICAFAIRLEIWSRNTLIIVNWSNSWQSNQPGNQRARQVPRELQIDLFRRRLCQDLALAVAKQIDAGVILMNEPNRNAIRGSKDWVYDDDMNTIPVDKNQNKHLTSRIEKLEAMLQHQGLNDIESQMSPKGGDQELDNINQRMSNQQKYIETSKRDQRSKFLVINGIDEKEREDLLDVVKLINHKLKLSISNINIDNCYRMEKIRQDKKPRLLAVKFVNKWMKHKVFVVKKNLKKSGVVISEMLSC
ncbi:hypothetical protein JTB14_001344 [Gonioctena quinquepunctata]|nr:hypothetical protein JTB14_001344 [Gonioctena quinquepunctata]